MTTTTAETFTGWACVDCLMILANGEDNPEWSEEEAAAHHAAMDRECDGCEVTLGLMASEHDEECPNVWHFYHPGIEYHLWRGGQDCWCEHDEFSWSSCDVCGSQLGGSRDAVTFWPKEVTA